MIEHLTSTPAILFYISFWILIEYQEVGKHLALTNPFEGIPTIMTMPRPLQDLTLLFSNMFIVFFGIGVILLLAFFSEPWYIPILTVFIGYAIGLILHKTTLLPSIFGHRTVAYFGFLWIAGFGYYAYYIIST